MIYGNQELFAALAASAAGGRLCHAYLFWGPQGVGKKTFAHRFAQMILCLGGTAPALRGMPLLPQIRFGQPS